MLASLVWVFTKLEGDNLNGVDYFPFSDWTMPKFVYICNICLAIVPACFVWTIYSLVTRFKREVMIAALLITFRLPWFLLTANSSFFRIRVGDMGVIPIGYDALMFVLLGLVVLKATIYEQ